MPNKKISDLDEWTTPVVDDDLFIIQPAAELTKHYKLKKSNLPGAMAVLTRESFASLATNGDGSDTGIDITSAPAGDVVVLIDGIEVELLGDKTGDCYFSTDAGATALALNSITAGASLYWNASINAAKSIPITFGDLTTNDRITLIY